MEPNRSGELVGTISVLLIEDDLVDEIALLREVSDQGLPYAVTVSHTLAEARKSLSERSFDVVLADYNLPDGLVFDLLETLTDHVVIVMTGAGDEEIAARALHLGVHDYLIKGPQRKYLKLLPHRIEVSLRNARMEQDLRASEERYRSLVEWMPEAVVVHQEGRIVYLNPAANNMFGAVSAASLIGSPIMERIHPHHRDIALARAAGIASLGGATPLAEMQCLTIEGGVIEAEVQSTSILYGGKPAYQTSLRDIGERKRSEQAHVALQAQFREAQKLEAIGQLAGGIAHYFNNLLTVIKMATELAMDGVRASDPLRQDLVDIAEAADRAKALTAQLLAFSRRQVIAPVPLDLRELLTGIEPMLRRLIREDIALTVTAPERLGIARADRGQLEQVVLNLAVNARDAMPDGGTLTLAAEDVVLDAAYAVAHPDVVPGSYVMLAVRDTGEGMAPSTIEHIFEPFFTTKEPGKGTGLGLATVYGIVRQSGGTIGVESALGVGTTFRIYLPTVEAQAMAAGAAPRGKQVRGTETILVVEDESQLLEIARRFLERAGYTVLTARNGTLALDLLRQRAGAVDLVMTDVVMPELGGAALASEIEAAGHAVKVLFTSGYTMDADLRLRVQDATAAFLEKPYSADSLTRKIRELLDN